jgi:hypothetical protein
MFYAWRYFVLAVTARDERWQNVLWQILANLAGSLFLSQYGRKPFFSKYGGKPDIFAIYSI